MKKLWLLGGMALSLGLLAVLADGGVYAGDDQSPETASEIMKKTHGKTGLRKTIEKNLKANPVDWDKVQKDSKVYAELAGMLGKATPPKGDKASWEKLTKAFADTTKEMNTDAEKKDAPAVQGALGKIGQMCMPCHGAHRGS
jgi:cytochrome c556